MATAPFDLAQVRLDNALALFDEFVRLTARHADAATLRGLERRFAERVQIQPSYWSQIKGRSRQIGERLARQFEVQCHKPRGWMDHPHHGTPVGTAAAASVPGTAQGADLADAAADESLPRNDDERFIVALVLTYYRRHPQRARTRLLDLLGEVLVPGAGSPPTLAPSASPPALQSPPSAEDTRTLWLRSQSGVSPLKQKR
jgi:hypothetical protein